jgi:uncharacterized sulfatase
LRPLSRREFLATASAAAGAAALGVGCSSDDARAGRPGGVGPQPNVIYVTCDDLGTTLGAYGSKQVVSPNIDHFAKRAVLFERCYCQIAICSSSRTSILTGVRPETSGLIALNHDWQAAMPEAKSLPRLFRDAGYQTTSVGKIFDLRGGGPDDCWDDVVAKWDVSDRSATVGRLEGLAAGDVPFFLALGSSQPHCPWEPSLASMAEYNVDEIELLGPGRTFAGEMIDCAGASAPVVSDAEAREITARYFGEITDVDRAFGALMAAVDRLGLFDNTIIIFWSGDHGFHLGQNDRWGKWSCYDAATRVPLMMSVPQLTPQGSRAAGIVECVDMYPTLVELCGLGSAPQPLDGLSFAPVLKDPSTAWKHSAFSVWGLEEVGVRSIKTAQYDYIATEGNFLREPGYELYDMLADRTESDNLYSTLPKVATVLAERLALGPEGARPDAPPIVW